jgi:hypothetical protein
MDPVPKAALASALVGKTIQRSGRRAIAEREQRPDTQVASGQCQISAASDKECESCPACYQWRLGAHCKNVSSGGD